MFCKVVEQPSGMISRKGQENRNSLEIGENEERVVLAHRLAVLGEAGLSVNHYVLTLRAERD